MIIEPDALALAAEEVVEMAVSNDSKYDGLIVAAFGDPGLAQVQKRCRTPAVGIVELSIREASAGGRRFGIATTTPALKAAIEQRVTSLGLSAQYTGLRILTSADPADLVKDKDRLRDALADLVHQCVDHDGAQAVIIGGGPLGEAARGPGAAVLYPDRPAHSRSDTVNSCDSPADVMEPRMQKHAFID